MRLRGKLPRLIATLTVAGGGRIGLSPLPRDPAPLLAWHPDVILSLTEPHEMAPAAHAALARSGARLMHFPIPDYGVPGPGWAELGPALHAVLDSGGGVLLHCMGGRGRSGTIALRLLVERGEPAEAALLRLRAVRPGAVETPGQMAWASV